MNKEHNGPIVSAYKPRPPGAKRDRRRALISIGVLLAMALALWLFLGTGKERVLEQRDEAVVISKTLNDIIQVTGSIETPVRRTILAPEEGTLSVRNGNIGDWVTANSMVARLESPSLIDSHAELKKNLSDSERDLAKLIADRRFETERTAIELAKRERAVQEAEDALARARELERAGSGTSKDTQDKDKALNEARENLVLSRLSAEESRYRYEFSRETYQNKIDDLHKRIAELENRIAGLVIGSPIDGRLLSWRVEEGDRISRYSALAVVADTTKPQASFQVPEASINRLSLDMPVLISVNNSAWPGRITSIGREASASDTYGTTIAITTAFTGEHPEFSAGASATGEILLGIKENALVLPRGPYLSSGGNRWVYVVDGGYAVRTAVSFGISRGTEIEVLSGLKAGDRIITSDYSSFIGEERIKLGGSK